MTTVESLYAQAMELSADDLAELAARLVDSLPGEKGPGYDEAWRKELDRREAEHDAAPETAIPWDEAMERIFAPLRHK